MGIDGRSIKIMGARKLARVCTKVGSGMKIWCTKRGCRTQKGVCRLCSDKWCGGGNRYTKGDTKSRWQ